MSGGLEAEFSVLRDAGEAMRTLIGLGVPRQVVVFAPLWGAVGFVHARPCGDELFDPEVGKTFPNVSRVLAFGIRDNDGEILDLVAFHPDRPGRFRRRYGIVDFLGEEAVLRAGLEREPLVLHPTPLAWLAAGGTGACVLDATASLRLAFAGIPEIHATCPLHGAAIDRRLELEGQLSRPRVMVPERMAS